MLDVWGVWCWMCGKSGVNLLLRREAMVPHGEEGHYLCLLAS